MVTRGRVVRLAMLAVLVLVATSCDWPTYQFSAARTGFNPTEFTVGVHNVSRLEKSWQTADPYKNPVAVAGGYLYASGVNVEPMGRTGLSAYRVDPSNPRCVGTPRTCAPDWHVPINCNWRCIIGPPTVAGSRVFLTTVGYDENPQSSRLHAFATTDNGGEPLWTADLPVNGTFASPTVANGVVYVVSGFDLMAYDAAGVRNCSGTPKRCTPVWTADIFATNNHVAIADGVVYVTGPSDLTWTLYAFDAAAPPSACSEATSTTPRICQPIWTSTTSGGSFTTPAVANGKVYVGLNNASASVLHAYDATGTSNCGGTPRTCTPLWIAPTGDSGLSAPAATNDVVYVGRSGALFAFSADGAAQCGFGVCPPLWTAPVLSRKSPIVANGVVYASNGTSIAALDAAGTIGCTGTPKVCNPIWTSPSVGINAQPALVDGRLYVSGVGVYVFTVDGA